MTTEQPTTVRTYWNAGDAYHIARILKEARYTAEVQENYATSLFELTTNAPADACAQCVVCQEATAWTTLDGMCSLCYDRARARAGVTR